jgi:hypothetical protein
VLYGKYYPIPLPGTRQTPVGTASECGRVAHVFSRHFETLPGFDASIFGDFNYRILTPPKEEDRIQKIEDRLVCGGGVETG